MEISMVQLHLAALAFSVCVIVYSDIQGFLYFIGKKQVLSKRFVRWSHDLAWVGLILMIVTGILLTVPGLNFYLADPMFQLKMCFVLALIINGFAIGRLMHVAADLPYKALERKQKITLLISGFVSATGWISSTAIGFLFF